MVTRTSRGIRQLRFSGILNLCPKRVCAVFVHEPKGFGNLAWIKGCSGFDFAKDRHRACPDAVQAKLVVKGERQIAKGGFSMPRLAKATEGDSAKPPPVKRIVPCSRAFISGITACAAARALTALTVISVITCFGSRLDGGAIVKAATL